MATITQKVVFRVDIIESERGWGQKVDETKYFSNEKAARDFCKEYNKKNDKDYVPDWYMRADYIGEEIKNGQRLVRASSGK